MKKTIKRLSKNFIRSILVAALVVATLPVIYASTASAARECDTVFYSSNDIMYYNPCEVCSSTGETLLGNSNEEKVFKWLKGKGFNSAQATGMMGNMWTESSFNPFRMQTTYSQQGIEAVLPIDSHPEKDKAFGLVQWDSGRRQQILTQIEDKFPNYITLINAHGKSADGYKDAPDGENDRWLSFELEFMYQELSNGYKSVYDKIKAQPDTVEGVVEAAEIWNRKYEVSGDYSQDRHEKAKTYYEQFKTATLADAFIDGCVSNEPGGDIVWYSQTDPRWAGVGYAGGTIGPIGCGPSSMAIILATLYDKTITPADVAAVAGVQNGGTSSHANLIKGVNERWGINISTKSLSMNEAIEYVKSGKGFVWMGGSGAPPFTNGGHLVAMVGVTSDGQITIADPYGDGPNHQRIANYPATQIAADSASRYGVPKP